jgi:hypothetical protein
MFNLNIFHILICFIVYIVNRCKKHNKYHKDLIQETFDTQLITYIPTKFCLYALTLIPIYFFIDKPDVAEHICVLYVFHLLIKSLQNVINPENVQLEYTTAFFVISLLVSLQYNYIGRGYIMYVYTIMFVHSFINIVNTKRLTTSSVSNDVFLAHLLFFIFRTN